MATGEAFVRFEDSKLVETEDLRDRFFTYINDGAVETTSMIYDVPGVFYNQYSFAFANDEVSIEGSALSTDGLGHFIRVDSEFAYCQNVSFENESGVNYQVSLHWTHGPQISLTQNTIRVNSLTGNAQYVANMEYVGSKAEPDFVQTIGSTIQFRIDSLCEPGVSFSGRTAIVYLKNPVASASSVGIPILTVAYSGGFNIVTTSDFMGQTVASVDPEDYEVILLGPTIRRSGFVSSDEYCILGTILGAGSGNPPSLVSNNQNLISVSLSNINTAFDSFVTESDSVSNVGGKTEIPTGTWSASSVVYDDRLYVFGGLTLTSQNNPSSLTTDISVYNPEDDTWTVLTSPMPDTYSGHTSAVVVGDIAYIAGGRDHAGPTDVLRRFDLTTGAFLTNAAPMFDDRYGGSLVAIDGRYLHYLGGYNTSAEDTNWRYDIVLDAWTDLEAMDQPLGLVNAVAYNENIYVLGGTTELDHANRSVACHVYFTSTDTWQTLESMPDGYSHEFGVVNDAPCFRATILEYHGVIHILCGQSDQNALASHYGYNIGSDEWVRFENPQIPYSYSRASGIINDTIYMAGGIVRFETSTEVTDQVVACDIENVRVSSTPGVVVDVGSKEYNGSSATTATVTRLGQARTRHSVCKMRNGAFLITGGTDGNVTFYDSTEIFFPETNTIAFVANMPAARARHGSISIPFGEFSEQILLFSGDSGGSIDNDVFMYNPHTNAWFTNSSSGIVNMTDYGIARVGNFVYLTSNSNGVGPQESVVAWDIHANAWYSQPIGTFVTAMNEATSVAYGDSVFTIGADTEILEFPSNLYSPAVDVPIVEDLSSAIPNSLSYGGMDVWDGVVYIYNPVTQQLYSFSPNTRALTVVASGLPEVYGSQMKISNGRMYLFGGSSVVGMTDNSNAIQEVVIPGAAVTEKSVQPKNYVTNKVADSVGFKTGNVHGRLTWNPFVTPSFIKMGANLE